MRIFVSVLKNNLRRLSERKSRLFLFLFLTACSIAAALFINTKAGTAGNVAVVSAGGATLQSAYINITRLEQAPPLSDLVMGKYDAAVFLDGRGGYTIQTVKDDGFKQTLEKLISDPAGFTAGHIESRGYGTNIVGFMMMFILMQGISLIFMFAEDIEQKQIMRVAASPVSFTGYLCAHGLFTFAALAAPVMLMLAIVRSVLNIEIGLSLPAYLYITALLGALAVSFALFLTAFLKKYDSASMVGSAVIVLTSILAGSFYSFDRGNRVLGAIIRILPQKAFLTMAEMMEQGRGISSWYRHGLYIAVLIAFFFAAAIIKTRTDYVKS